MDIIWKACVGAAVTAAIALAAKRGAVLPGILPLVPTFTIIALWFIGSQGALADFRTTCLAGAKTVPAYLAFLAAASWAAGVMDYRLAILAGLAAWGATVAVIFASAALF